MIYILLLLLGQYLKIKCISIIKVELLNNRQSSGQTF
jgi:hypothetical protein